MMRIFRVVRMCSSILEWCGVDEARVLLVHIKWLCLDITHGLSRVQTDSARLLPQFFYDVI